METVHNWFHHEQDFSYYAISATKDGGISLTAYSKGCVRMSTSIHIEAEAARAIAANLIAAADALEAAE